MIKYVLLIAGIIPSAMAQILLKFASNYPLKTPMWFLFIFLSLCSYGLSFILYTIIFKYFPVSVASPVMTVSVMLAVFIFGWIIGETISPRQLLGLACGVASIILIIFK
ncbi:MAG TPA: DMT family transporter [Spirochaetota bacterium]|nr:MAG: 4-amino-4-deoxy-L-arabinose-phosphoundecaprenol flippase subunit ArnE [Spirochaetes bacterium ADurb.Bin133]HNZ27479.1 DMT family transporter [Spirochaetota bacterium]HOF01855.1 DMT family transporter [Spirochaetota bacterium]HOS33856.1 DMT family transporter [Spirochaetota bacterium]HOS56845.1 DMT family transporter [Spirochaetota bacterium]